MSSQLTTIPGHFLLGNTKDFAKDTLGFVQSCAQKATHVAKARIAFRDFFLLLSPEAVNHVLQDKHKNYKKSFAYEGLKDFLGQGLLTAEGDAWLKKRRAMQPAFARHAMEELVPRMRSEVQHWLKERAQGNTTQLDTQKDFLELTCRILAHTTFGVARHEGTRNLNPILSELRDYANARMKNPFSPPAFIPTPRNQRFKRAKNQLHQDLHALIEAASISKNHHLVDLLLERSNGDSQSLLDDLATIYIAGQETTTNALCFALHALWRHPHAQDRLVEELQHHDLEQLELTDWLELPYLNAVVNETLRLYPPAWAISRENLEEDEICGYKIPAGSTIFLSIYAMQRHEGHWKKPNEFLPERFLNLEKEHKAFLPFAKGPRKCIGHYFAQLEMNIILAYVMKNFKLSLVANPEMKLITPMTLNPKNPAIFKLEKRPRRATLPVQLSQE